MKTVKAVLLVFIFAAFSLQIAMLRGPFENRPVQPSATPFYDQQLTGAERGRPNLRVVSSALGASIDLFVRTVRDVVFLYPERSAFYRGTPWKDNGERARTAEGPLVPLSVYFLFVAATLTPVLLLAMAWYAAFWQRAALLSLALIGICGWHPVTINVVFNVASLILDWPRSYYLFTEPLRAYDFVALTAVTLTVLYCAARTRFPAWEIVVIVVLTHLIIEYLSVIFAAGVVARILFDSETAPWPARRQAAARTALIAAGAYIAMYAITIAVFYLNENTSGLTGDRYAVYRELNFTWFRTITANMISLLAVPFPIGLLFGALSGFFLGQGAVVGSLIRDMAVLAGMLAAYLAVFAMGFLTLSYPSEMGRQFAPVVLIALLLGVRTAEWAVVRLRLRAQRPLSS